jgi:hypothetical protein
LPVVAFIEEVIDHLCVIGGGDGGGGGGGVGSGSCDSGGGGGGSDGSGGVLPLAATPAGLAHMGAAATVAAAGAAPAAATAGSRAAWRSITAYRSESNLDEQSFSGACIPPRSATANVRAWQGVASLSMKVLNYSILSIRATYRRKVHNAFFHMLSCSFSVWVSSASMSLKTHFKYTLVLNAPGFRA